MRVKPAVLRRDAVAAILLALLPAIYFLPATIGQLILALHDALVFGLPLRVAAAEMIRDGHLPLWNPYIFCGMPLHASAQAGLLFPLNWLFVVAGAGAAMNFAVIGSYAAAGVGAFLYARRSGGSSLGGIVTAVVWQFCGASVGQISHTNILQVIALLPWIFWSLDGYAAARTAARGAVVAVFVALQLFAGHQQTAVYSLLLAGAYVVVNAIAEQDRSTRRAWIVSLVLLLAGVLLAAVQLLPTLELMRHSLRNEATYEFFSSFSMPPVFLLTFFAPFIVGGGDGTLFRAPYISEPYYPEYCGYVAVAALMLALLAPLVRGDRQTLFWSCAAIVALALAIGRFWPGELYRLVYHVPVLNLFRVPARHLMEVDFALAVLAGRAVTFLPEIEQRRRVLLTAAITGAVLVFTCIAVTWLRPAEFRLARVAPLTVLRAPELFVPVVLAALSAWVLLQFARGKRWSGGTLVVLLVADLALWGQFTGWRSHSPAPDHAVFRTPDVVQMLRDHAGPAGTFRVLTLDRTLDQAMAGAAQPPPFEIHLQPDVYMMHRIENAAGYDGFGLARYSRLTGDMKVWGEFVDAARSLGASRELDLLNVRYLLAASPTGAAPQLLPATVKIGEFLFHDRDLKEAHLTGGARLDFHTPPIEVTRVALTTNLSWSAQLSDGTVAGTLTLQAEDGRTFSFQLRVGIDTSEWAHDRPSLRASIRHSRAPVGLSSRVELPGETFDGHNFVTSSALPERVTIIGGSIEAARISEAQQFGMTVQRLSFVDEETERTVPLRNEWLRAAAGRAPTAATRWQLLERGEKLGLYENPAALPRTWLASEAVALPDEQKLEVIRSGKFADGTQWQPERTILADEQLQLGGAPAGEQHARIVRYEPNEVEIAASTPSAAVLVLADNYYPGWRVTVNGERAELLRVNYNLRGVQLPPGEHVVRFTYRPMSAIAGAAVSLLVAALLAFWCLTNAQRQQQRR
jgi:hypothetical protein